MEKYTEKKYNEVIRMNMDTFDGIKSLLEDTDLDKFRLACNYLTVCGYKSDVPIVLRDQIELRKIANKQIRQRMPKDFVDLYDYIVTKSKQKLWGGDELYKLFAYECIPYYVRSCLKSAMSVSALMKQGVNTVDEIMLVSSLIQHPLYWELFDCPYNAPKCEIERIQLLDRNAWGLIGKYLMEGKVADAFNHMQRCQMSRDADIKRFGDNFRSIALEKYPA